MRQILLTLICFNEIFSSEEEKCNKNCTENPQIVCFNLELVPLCYYQCLKRNPTQDPTFVWNSVSLHHNVKSEILHCLQHSKILSMVHVLLETIVQHVLMYTILFVEKMRKCTLVNVLPTVEM